MKAGRILAMLLLTCAAGAVNVRVVTEPADRRHFQKRICPLSRTVIRRRGA
jgi:hypothetical protein